MDDFSLDAGADIPFAEGRGKFDEAGNENRLSMSLSGRLNPISSVNPSGN